MARSGETARYREAAQMILDQLDWCVEYLRDNHKEKLAQQLAANTASIRQRIDEPSGDKTVTEEPAG